MVVFSIYQENCLRLLAEGKGGVSKEEFFCTTLAEEFQSIADSYECKIDIKPLRLAEAQQYWLDDVRALIDAERITSSEIPCHIKQSAYLAYWLRRRIVVDDVEFIGKSESKQTKIFLDYPNEMVSYITGLRLLLYCENITRDTDTEQAIKTISNFQFRQEYLSEVATFLRHKNVSPHSMYLMFSSLLHPAPIIRPLGNSPIRLVTSEK